MAGTLLRYFSNYTTDHLGQVFLMPITDVTSYGQLNVEIYCSHASATPITAHCTMGVLSGQTLGQDVGLFNVGGAQIIHSFPVIGPEFAITLTGAPPNTPIAVEGWVYMR